MPKIPGADTRLSRTLQSLDRFTPAGIEALACVGLALLERINNDAPITGRVLDTLYALQDALHGVSDQLPDALAAFLSTVEEEKNHG